MESAFSIRQQHDFWAKVANLLSRPETVAKIRCRVTKFSTICRREGCGQMHPSLHVSSSQIGEWDDFDDDWDIAGETLSTIKPHWWYQHFFYLCSNSVYLQGAFGHYLAFLEVPATYGPKDDEALLPFWQLSLFGSGSKAKDVASLVALKTLETYGNANVRAASEDKLEELLRAFKSRSLKACEARASVLLSTFRPPSVQLKDDEVAIFIGFPKTQERRLFRSQDRFLGKGGLRGKKLALVVFNNLTIEALLQWRAAIIIQKIPFTTIDDYTAHNTSRS